MAKVYCKDNGEGDQTCGVDRRAASKVCVFSVDNVVQLR
jgi:hypothetical protein